MSITTVVIAPTAEDLRQQVVADLQRRIEIAEGAFRFRALTTPRAAEATLAVLRELRQFWTGVVIATPGAPLSATPPIDVLDADAFLQRARECGAL